MKGASLEKTTYDRRAKAKVCKSGPSAKIKTVQLGENAGVFAAVVYFNLTYGCLEGTIHVSNGQSIPDVNRFAAVETSSLDMDANTEEKIDVNADFYHSIAVNGNSADWVGNLKAGYNNTLPVVGGIKTRRNTAVVWELSTAKCLMALSMMA
ncbi:hypothetical protein LZ30DRAFT_692068 [Colletotrichum cereale]|nr:hypothetical protein LZ30DRAFT_692068 [Colletotrichum cereale]